MIEHNGKQYLTVTEVLGRFSGLENIPKDVLLNAANRGTRTHSAIACKLKGLGDWGVDEDLIGYMASAEKVLPSIGKIYHMEERLFDDEMLLTGQADLIADYDGEVTLIDWKTSAKAHSKIWVMQAAAYCRLANQIGRDALFIKLDRHGGDPELHYYSPEQLEEAWQRFLLCYQVYKLFFANKKDEDLCQVI